MIHNQLGLGRRPARVGSDGASMACAARSRSCRLQPSPHGSPLHADPDRHQRRRGCLPLPDRLPVCRWVCVRLQTQVCVCAHQYITCLCTCVSE